MDNSFVEKSSDKTIVISIFILIAKLIITKLVYVGCFLVVYGIGENSFSSVTRIQAFLLSLTVMSMFAPVIFVIYKVKKFKDRRFSIAFNLVMFIDAAILIQAFASLIL